MNRASEVTSADQAVLPDLGGSVCLLVFEHDMDLRAGFAFYILES